MKMERVDAPLTAAVTQPAKIDSLGYGAPALPRVWGTIMDRITESLLDEFSREHGLEHFTQENRFEHFASFVTVRRQFSETFDTDDIVTGSGGDIGIDAIAIIVNGALVNDVEALNEMAAASPHLDVMFIFVQASRSASFEAAKIGTFAFGVQDFFATAPKLPRNKAVADAAAVMAAIYSHSGKFKRGNPSLRLYYATTGRWTGEANLEARRKAAEDDLRALNLFKDVEFSCVGADVLQRLYSQTKNSIAREFTFVNRTVAPEIAGVSQAYLGFISAPEFVSIVKDEDGDVIRSIFYDNVRDWQGDNPVNTEIGDTLKSDHKARFALMNNGVTVIARNLQLTGNKFHIEDFQIVNGCQTSHVLFNNEDLLDETVMIPLRLISTQDERVVESIIRATNRQTEVNAEQFFAMTEFAKQLEAFFQTFQNGKKLFYERRSRQYDRLDIERTRVVTPRNMIRAFASMFLNEPYRTTRNYARLLDRIGTDIFAEGHKLEPYYVAAYSLYKLEYMFRVNKLDSALKPARYHLLLAARIIANKAALPRMNARDMTAYCKVITDILWDAAAAEELFTKAADAVSAVAAGDLSGDNIRTQPFTDKLMKHCAGV
jgi:hypothetical protein